MASIVLDLGSADNLIEGGDDDVVDLLVNAAAQPGGLGARSRF
jgi:hypothetical protein